MPEKEETSSTNVGNTSEEGKTLPKAVIKNVDMSEEMQQETISIAATALEKYSIEKDIASAIKKECDQRWQPTWHVVVGKNFGSYVTHGEFQHTCIPNIQPVSIPSNYSFSVVVVDICIYTLLGGNQIIVFRFSLFNHPLSYLHQFPHAQY